jgi:ribose 5-phosphate isomerase B
MNMNVVLAGDHYTVEVINQLQSILEKRDIKCINLGTKDPEQKVSLQEIIPSVVQLVKDGEAEFGILTCGTGVGVEIGANRFKGIRASLCRDAAQAKNARVYDDANVLCLGSWYNDDFPAILNAWLDSHFDGDEKRTKMIKDFDSFS